MNRSLTSQGEFPIGHRNYGENDGTKTTSVLCDEPEQFVLATKRGKTSWIPSKQAPSVVLTLFLERAFSFSFFFSRAWNSETSSVRAPRYSPLFHVDIVVSLSTWLRAKPMAPVCQGASRRRQPFVKGITLGPFSPPRNIKIPTYLRRAWRANRLRCTYFSHVCTVARGARDFFVFSKIPSASRCTFISLSRNAIQHLLRSTMIFD